MVDFWTVYMRMLRFIKCSLYMVFCLNAVVIHRVGFCRDFLLKSPKREMWTFEVDFAISVHVSLFQHDVHLLVREVLPQVGHGRAELMLADEAVAVLVEHSERLPQLLFGVVVTHFAPHHHQKLVEVYVTIACNRLYIESVRRSCLQMCCHWFWLAT